MHHFPGHKGGWGVCVGPTSPWPPKYSDFNSRLHLRSSPPPPSGSEANGDAAEKGCVSVFSRMGGGGLSVTAVLPPIS